MSNLILQVEALQDYMRRGMPDGPDYVVKSFPILIARIEELERALIPFARAANKDNQGMPLIHVFHNDCKTAFTKLSKAAAIAATPKPEEWAPAE